MHSKPTRPCSYCGERYYVYGMHRHMSGHRRQWMRDLGPLPRGARVETDEGAVVEVLSVGEDHIRGVPVRDDGSLVRRVVTVYPEYVMRRMEPPLES